MLILMLFAPQMNIIFAISTSNNPTSNKIYAWERWRTSAWYLPNFLALSITAMSDCATTCSIFLDLSSCFKRLAVLAEFPPGWSFFGKVGGAKSDIGRFFCANTIKISLIMLWNPKILYHGIALGQCDHFITSEVQNISKIGVASHEVGVAKASWWVSRPTNWIGSSTCAFPCSAWNCNGLMLILGFYW